ncbi:hypothetical protein P3S51_13440 (plasmid) [Acinetobacter sp. ANC 7201]|nr:hypothetical protein [Acinetobacter sp. ANC 7201]WFP98137.1 hypothetical protein P3S51_13440 [Acinetobacter sp. ANC 7201]
MRKILILMCLFSINISYGQTTDINLDEIIEPYINELAHKYEKMEEINKKILNLSGREGQPEAIEEWKILNCERRAAIRSYVQSLNNAIESKEVETAQQSKDVKEILNSIKNEYLLEMAQEDEVLRKSMGMSSTSFGTMTIDWLCRQ